MNVDARRTGFLVFSALVLAVLGFFLLLHNPFRITDFLVTNELVIPSALIGIALALWISTQSVEARVRVTQFGVFFLPTAAIFYVGIRLAGIWVEPTESFFLIGGTIQNSDAWGWIAGAWRLLEFGDLDSWSQRRPINALLHALRLLVAGDLHSSIALAALTVALVSLLASWQIGKSLGWIPGAMLFIGLIKGIEPYLATTMTEVHGLVFGCMSFALLWNGTEKKSLREIFLGLVFLSVGLSVRSGPFFIYPLLIAWLVWEFRPEKRSYLILVGSVLALAVGPLFSGVLVHFWGDGSNTPQSNFLYTLYAMTTGTGDWARIISERPDLFVEKSEREIAKTLWNLSVGMVHEQPHLILRYYGNEFVRFITSFLRFDLGINFLLGSAALLIGVWRVERMRMRLFFVFFLGTALSAPFLMDTAGARPFVVVQPFITLINAIGVFAILEIVKFVFPRFERGLFFGTKVETPSMKLVPISVLALSTLLMSPVFLFIHKATYPKLFGGCPMTQTTLAVSGLNSNIITIDDDLHWKLGQIPSIPKYLFLSGIPSGEHKNRYLLAANTSPPYSFVQALGEDKEHVQLVVKPPLSKIERRVQVLCGSSQDHSSYIASGR